MAEHTLKQQQDELIAHLLNPAQEKTPDWLQAIPAGPLKLIANLALRKRMLKIKSVFPKTFDHLEDILDRLEIDFASTYVQTEIWKKTNALQFLEFLQGLENDPQPAPPYIYDLAQLEYAIWHVAQEGASADGKRLDEGNLKLNPLAMLITCAFNVRNLVDGSMESHASAKKQTLLAIAPAGVDRAPAVTELPADIFEWLSNLETSGNSPVSPSEIGQLLALNIVEYAE